MTITLESSLNSLKIALAQHGTAGAVSATQTLTQGKLQSTTAGSGNTSATLSLTQSTVWRLDMQRQLDSAYLSQSMLEVAGNANADIMTRLKNLKKVTVQATNQTLAQSERAFLASQFEGIRKSLLSNTSQATAAQANFTPQGVITTLQF